MEVDVYEGRRHHRLAYRGAAVIVTSELDLPEELLKPWLKNEVARHITAIDAAWAAAGERPPWEHGIEVDAFLQP